jgi:hypothetical protein
LGRGNKREPGVKATHAAGLLGGKAALAATIPGRLAGVGGGSTEINSWPWRTSADELLT